MKKLFTVSCLIVAMASSSQAQSRTTLAEQAATAHEAAISRYRAGKWAEAADLFDEFVSRYSSSEKMPANYLRLARSRWQLKELDKVEAAADEVIKRFYPSRFWLYAWGTKLVTLASTKENDKYLDAVEALLRRTNFVPPCLWGINSPNWRAGERIEQEHWPWDAWGYRGVPFENDWSADLIKMADTPERATRALKALNKMFSGKPEDIPVDWQHAHLCLLRQSGDSAGADALLKTYVDNWGKDARAVMLYSSQADYLGSIKETKAEDAIWDILKKGYAGRSSLDRAFYDRVMSLQSQKRMEDFFKNVHEYILMFPINTSGYIGTSYWNNALTAWFNAALTAATSGEQGELKKVLSYLDDADKKPFPTLPGAARHWRLRAAVVLKDDATATRAAEELLSDKFWCADNFAIVLREAGGSPAVAKVVETARAQRKVPVADPASKAVELLANLRARIKEDQPRFSEEICQEMFDKYRNDNATIQGVAELARYYYQKVMAEPRDKWMNRMVEAYARHPLTEDILLDQVRAETGQRNYERVGAICDTGIRLFPGGAQRFFDMRITAFRAAQDPKGTVDFVQKYLGDRVNADPFALRTLMEFQRQAKMNDAKSRGDQWLAAAQRLAGTRGELYCRISAYGEFMPSSGDRLLESGIAVARELKAQTIDTEVAWMYEFSECNILAEQQKGSAAAKLVADTLGSQTSVRDLYGRLYYSYLGSALVKENKNDEVAALVKKIRDACPGQEDQLAATWLEGTALSGDKDKRAAAKKYMELLDKHPYPALIGSLISRTQTLLGNSAEMHTATQKWIREFGGAQDLVPDILFDEGIIFLNARNTQALVKVRSALKDRYNASRQRDELEERTQRVLNPSRKN